MKREWNFQKSAGVLEKIPSTREVWIFSGTPHSSFIFPLILLIFYKNIVFPDEVGCLFSADFRKHS